jgi:hypothetical protein
MEMQRQKENKEKDGRPNQTEGISLFRARGRHGHETSQVGSACQAISIGQ